MTDPRVTLRADTGAAASSRRLEGAEAAAGQALMFSRLGGRGATSISALVNGAVGVVSFAMGGLRRFSGSR